MPFTPSHAVVALPFVRTPLVPAAIAIGAMTPDLPLFLRTGLLSYQTTHTNVGASVLVALVLLACWYLLLRPAVRELAPIGLARRLPDAWDATGLAAAWRAIGAPHRGARAALWRLPPIQAARILASLALGVLSHIAWDAFTHEGRWGTRLLPGLADPWGPLSGVKWLQHGSSVLGLLVLAVSAAVWLHRRPAPRPPSRLLPRGVRLAWMLALPALLVAALLGGLVWYGPLTAEWTIQHLAYRVLPPACALWGAATVALCVGIVVRRARGASRRGAGA